MVSAESSTCPSLANLQFKAIQRHTLPYVAVKDGHPLFSSIYESTCSFCRVCSRKCEVHPANDTCQLFNKATFIHKNKNFFTATLFILITAKAVRPTTRRYNSVRHSSYIWRHKHLMQCSPHMTSHNDNITSSSYKSQKKTTFQQCVLLRVTLKNYTFTKQH